VAKRSAADGVAGLPGVAEISGVPGADVLFGQLAVIGAAVSSPQRLKVLHLLGQAPKPVATLAEQTGQSIAAVSAHLQALKRACLVAGDRAGKQVIYRLADEAVARFMEELRVVGTTLLPEAREIRRVYLENRDDLAVLSERQLMREVKAGRVTLLDVRYADEYEAAHLPGAVNIPSDELGERYGELPRSRPVVAYCRGPYCITSVRSVARLRKLGFDARRLNVDVAQWRRAGSDGVSGGGSGGGDTIFGKDSR
jgi:ArsR family transcriptional regulator